MIRKFIFMGLFLSLCACSNQSVRQPKAPVVSRARACIDTPVEQQRQTAVEETSNSAVEQLLVTSRELKQTGDWSLAGSNIERALRIQPSSLDAHYELAQLRLDQDQVNQAIQLAQKGLGLSRSSQSKIKFLEIIAKAKYRLGDEYGALEIQQRIESLQGDSVWQS